MDSASFFKDQRINGWRLYLLICCPMALAIVLAMVSADLGAAEGVSSLIAYSVRWSVPFLYLAFMTSALRTLFPAHWTLWLQRNRSMIGLCLATGMGWQLLFIIWLVVFHRDYYVDQVYVLRDVIEGLTGYTFLLAMTLTSFERWRRRLSARQWKLLHTLGIYYLWAYAFSVYWHELFYYREPDWIDYIYYVGGASAWALRMAAWCKLELPRLSQGPVHTAGQLVLLTCGLLIILLSIAGLVGGRLWEGLAYEHLWDLSKLAWLELYMPYWPFIPYFPLLLAIPGAYLIARGWPARNS